MGDCDTEDVMTSQADLDICVVGGCGHVGLPLALTFAAAGLHVGVYDVDEEKVAKIRMGTMPFREDGAQELLEQVLATGRLELSARPAIVGRAQSVFLVIGTPLDELMNPRLAVFDQVVTDISPHLRNDALVVLRSTVFPGTTARLSEALSARGFFGDVAFCPERIAEGKALVELTSLPQIVGAERDSAALRAEKLFERLGVATVRTTSKEAELAKLFTNTWRYLKFAAANQFFTIATDAGVNYGNILRAIRFDYPRAQDLPGPGLAAGPCLLKDTMQLSSFTGNKFMLGHSAMLINEGLPDFIVRTLQDAADLTGARVAILGMAFKADSDDNRASLSYRLRRLLTFAGAEALCTDPYVQDKSFVSLEVALAQADIVIIGAPHAQYRDLSFGDTHVVDVWGITNPDMSIA